MRIAFLLSAMAAAAFAQPASLQIFGDRGSLTAGESIALQVVFRDSAQMPLPPQPVVWSSADPNIATVDQDGLVQSISLGLVRIRATAGNLRDDYLLQVVPQAIRLTPDSATIHVGETLRFTAVATNVRDEPLPGIQFSWRTLYTELPSPGDRSATIDSAGQLTAKGAGRITVRAEISYPSALLNHALLIFGSADVRIISLKDYSLSQVPLAIGPARRTLRPNGTLLSLVRATAQGQLVFYSSFDGIANGMVQWDSSGFRMLLPAGVGGTAPRTIIGDFTPFSMNASGDMLVEERVANGPQSVSLWSGGVWRNVAGRGAPIGYGGFVLSVFLSMESLADSGASALMAAYNTTLDPAPKTGIFRGYGTLFADPVVSSVDTLPGLPSPFNFVLGVYAVADDGTVWFPASFETRQALYRAVPGQSPERMIGTGDALLKSTVKRLIGLSVPNQMLRIASNGDVYFGVELNDGSNVLLRLPGGDIHAVQTVTLNSPPGAYAAHPDGGLLFFAASSAGTGILQWRGASLKLLASSVAGRPSNLVDGAPVTVPYSCAFLPQAVPVCLVSTSKSDLVAVRFDEPPKVLFRDSDPVTLTTPLNLASQIPGARAGAFEFTTGGFGLASVARLSDDGSLAKVFIAGSATPDGNRLSGAAVGLAGANVVRSTDGALYVISGFIGRYADTGYRTVVPSPVRLASGESVVPTFQLAVNANGDLVYTADISTRAYAFGLAVTAGGASSAIVRFDAGPNPTNIPGFGVVHTYSGFAIDDRRRVIAQLIFQNGSSGSFVWDNGVWTPAAAAGTRIGGQQVTSTPNRFRAWGGHLYALLPLQTYPVIAEWTGNGWSVVFDGSVPLPNGQLSQIAAFDVNSKGDLVIASPDSPSTVIAVQRADGSRKIVYSLIDLQPGDPFLFVASDVNIRDDGSVYILAQDESDERVFYQAKPLN